MGEGDALFRAILDRPEEDAPRLVYADWLEEYGDAARAEFIRVQCGLPRGDPAGKDLRRRERELLRAHGGAWRAGLPYWAARGRFERGFPARVEVPTGSFLRGASALWGRVPVTALQLSYRPAKFDRLAAHPDLALVSELDLRFLPLSPPAEGLLTLLRSPHLTRLRVLDLSGTSLDPALLRELAAAPALRGLT